MSLEVFSACFERALGSARVARVLAELTDRHAVLIAGEAGSGKSTVARGLAEVLVGSVGGVGAEVRRAAKERGLSLAAYDAWLCDNPSEDVALDAAAAQRVANGGVVVSEGRLAGAVGAWLRARGRRGLVTVRLRCAPSELARRLLLREMGEDTEVQQVLAHGSVDSLIEYTSRLRALGTVRGDAAAREVVAQIRRESDGRVRLRALYGADWEAVPFDLEVETSEMSQEQVIAVVVHRLSAVCRTPASPPRG